MTPVKLLTIAALTILLAPAVMAKAAETPSTIGEALVAAPSSPVQLPAATPVDPPMSAPVTAPAQTAAGTLVGYVVVTNGPIPDTAANRAKYGQPNSASGKRTSAAGN